MQKRVADLLFSIGVIAVVVAIAFLLLLVRTTIEARAENNDTVITETDTDSAQIDGSVISNGDKVIIEEEEVALAARPDDKIANLYWIWFVIAVAIAGAGAFFGIIMQRRKENQEL